MDQPRRLIFKDSPAPMPKDRVLAASNHTATEWDKRTKELKKQEMRWKQEARDQGEDVSSDNDDDDDDDDDDDGEVAGDVDWGVLEDEGTLTSAHPSLQGSESARSAEVDRPTDPSPGPVGAGESATPPGVPAEDRWMGGDGSAVAPRVLMEGAALLPRPMRRRGRVDLLPA